MTTSGKCPGCGQDTGTWATRCGACGTSLNAQSASGAGQPAAAPRPSSAPTTFPAPSPPASGAAGTSTWRGPQSGSPASASSPRWGGGQDVTRYLCAAAYLNRQYAELLIKQVSAEPHLGVAPAPACDIPVVLHHAYLANARRHIRDLLLALLLALTLLFYAGVQDAGLTLLVLFVAWVTVLSFEFSTRYGRHLQSLRPNRFDPAAAPPAPNSDIAARLLQIGAYAGGNVTAYSGYSPFIGYGIPLESWSLAFDVTAPGPQGGTPQDVDVTELYEHIARRLGTLALPSLEIEERVFVEGATLIGDPRFLPDPLGRPVHRIGQGQLNALKRAPEEGARPYLAAHSTGWGGQLVTSLFLRFTRSDSNLCVEAVQTVLPPLEDRYQVIDTLMPHPSLREVGELLSETLVSTPFLMLASPMRAAIGFSPDFGIRKRVRKQNERITALRHFDYGARLGVREQAAKSTHHRHFQKSDSGMALKVMEKRTLDALVEFAEARGIDVSELIQRQETIINNGIIATQGSTVSSSSVVSGSRSRVSMRILNKIPLINTD